MNITTVTRRDFLKSIGVASGGLVLAVHIPKGVARRINPTRLAPSVYLSIATNGAVTIIAHRSEMGQGARTSLPMAVADELEADWSRVHILQADGDPKYGDQNTDGSRSVRAFLEPLRKAGATARSMLEQAAAKQWKVPVKQVETKQHKVINKKSGATLSFGELVTPASRLKVPKKVKLKTKAELRFVGKKGAPPIVDGLAMTTGAAKYGADIRLPGMLTAVIVRPPAIRSTPNKYNEKAALSIPGVRHVEKLDGPPNAAPMAFSPLGGIAVVADNTWAAIKGARKLQVKWSKGPNSDYDSKKYREELEAQAAKPGTTDRNQGNVNKAFKKSKSVVEAKYYAPHLAQAPMEPPVAVARFENGACEVWAPTQHPQLAVAQLAGALKLDPSKIAVHVTLLGGGFGRKSKPDFIIEAALLARKLKVPVRVQWTREDDIKHGFFHSVSAQRLRATVDSGKITAWEHQSTFPSISTTFGGKEPSAGEMGQGITDLPFSVPNVRGAHGVVPAHVRIGWMRSVANVYHAFAIGSFVDELAHKSKIDPREFWLSQLGKRPLNPKRLGVKEFWNYGEEDKAHWIDPNRYRAVIEEVTKRSGWSKAKSEGRFVGLSAHRSFASYGATVVEVKKRGGALYVDKVHSVLDCGVALHPDRILSQIEGGAVFGLGLAIHGEISAKNGAIEQSNFHNFQVLRMNETPRVLDVHLTENGKLPGGVGEPGVPPVAPALANAVFAATGKRVRDLPLGKTVKFS